MLQTLIAISTLINRLAEVLQEEELRAAEDLEAHVPVGEKLNI